MCWQTHFITQSHQPNTTFYLQMCLPCYYVKLLCPQYHHCSSVCLLQTFYRRPFRFS